MPALKCETLHTQHKDPYIGVRHTFSAPPTSATWCTRCAGTWCSAQLLIHPLHVRV